MNYTCHNCRHRFSSASRYTPRCPKCNGLRHETHTTPDFTSESSIYSPPSDPAPSYSGGGGDSGGGGASGDW